jgi:hypothetical protein
MDGPQDRNARCLKDDCLKRPVTILSLATSTPAHELTQEAALQVGYGPMERAQHGGDPRHHLLR